MSADRDRARRIALAVGSVVVLVVILWIDIATGVWQELVILAGVTAGLVTFVLTVLVLDRIIARSTARRWAPVTRLALTEFLHAMADEEHSEISRGEIRPRLLPELTRPHDLDLVRWLHELRMLVVQERSRLTAVLGTWSSFLASSGDNEDLLIRIANLAQQLDRVRDESLEVEARATSAGLSDLSQEITSCNAHFRGIVEAIESRLEAMAPARVPRHRAGEVSPAA